MAVSWILSKLDSCIKWERQGGECLPHFTWNSNRPLAVCFYLYSEHSNSRNEQFLFRCFSEILEPSFG